MNSYYPGTDLPDCAGHPCAAFAQGQIQPGGFLAVYFTKTLKVFESDRELLSSLTSLPFSIDIHRTLYNVGCAQQRPEF